LPDPCRSVQPSQVPEPRCSPVAHEDMQWPGPTRHRARDAGRLQTIRRLRSLLNGPAWACLGHGPADNSRHWRSISDTPDLLFMWVNARYQPLPLGWFFSDTEGVTGAVDRLTMAVMTCYTSCQAAPAGGRFAAVLGRRPPGTRVARNPQLAAARPRRALPRACPSQQAWWREERGGG
jgi:hypothetical protein